MSPEELFFDLLGKALVQEGVNSTYIEDIRKCAILSIDNSHDEESLQPIVKGLAESIKILVDEGCDNADGRTIVEFEGVIPKNTLTFQSIRESILMDENFTLTDLEQMCATYAHQRFGILKLEGCKMFQQVNSDVKELAKISSGSVMGEYPHVTDYWMALLKEFTLRVNIEWETRNLTTQRI